MTDRYRVAYVSGTRADYGIVRKYLTLLSRDENIDFGILVTGAHLEDRYGHTVDKIRQDGFRIDGELPLMINNDSTSGVIEAMSRALSTFGNYFEHNKYDLVIVLGDRYEILSASIAAAMNKIPILHLHGGEKTLGNYDEFIRHAITKLSRFHFTSTEEYRRRVIQLGEEPDRVFYMGALGAENAREINTGAVDKEIKALTPFSYFTVVYHPETLMDSDVRAEGKIILSSLSELSDSYKAVLIGSNADTGAGVISSIFRDRASADDRFSYFESLSADSYLYLVKNSVALIGNSSSGIIEAPSLGTYTVNIGRRQEGRIRADSVYDVPCHKEDILSAIDSIIRKRGEGAQIENPYYKENTAEGYYLRTLEILEKNNSEPKEFYDLF